MEENVGGLDQQLRIAGGAVLGLVSLAILGDFTMGYDVPMVVSPVLGVLALVLLGTGLTGKCKINAMLGKDTSD